MVDQQNDRLARMEGKLETIEKRVNHLERDQMLTTEQYKNFREDFKELKQLITDQQKANRENLNKFFWIVAGVVVTQIVLFLLRGGINAP